MMIQNATNSSWTHRQTRCSIVGHYLLQLSYNVFVYAHHWSIVECKCSICVKLPNRFVSLYMIWIWEVNRSTTLIFISHVFRFCLPIMCSDSDNWIRKHCCAYQSSIFRGSNFKHFKQSWDIWIGITHYKWGIYWTVCVESKSVLWSIWSFCTFDPIDLSNWMLW